MKNSAGKHHIESVFVLLLAGMFAVCVLLVLFTGARAYSAVTARSADAYSRRVCAQYVAAKIRHADAGGAVYIGTFEGGAAPSGDTLFLEQTIGGKKYVTRIYCENGHICELFAEDGLAFRRDAGTEVMEANSLSFARDAGTGLLTVTAEDTDGFVTAVSVLPRCAEEAVR